MMGVVISGIRLRLSARHSPLWTQWKPASAGRHHPPACLPLFRLRRRRRTGPDTGDDQSIFVRGCHCRWWCGTGQAWGCSPPRCLVSGHRQRVPSVSVCARIWVTDGVEYLTPTYNILMTRLHSNFTLKSSFTGNFLIRLIEYSVGAYLFGPPCICLCLSLQLFSVVACNLCNAVLVGYSVTMCHVVLLSFIEHSMILTIK